MLWLKENRLDFRTTAAQWKLNIVGLLLICKWSSQWFGQSFGIIMSDLV